MAATLYSKDKAEIALELALLQRLVNQADISSLEMFCPDLEYSDICRIVEKFVSEGMIESAEGQYSLTNEGQTYFDNLNKMLGRRGIYRFVSFDERAKGMSIEPDEPYIPQKIKTGHL